MALYDSNEPVDEQVDPFESEWSIRGGAVAGLAATVVMGLVIMATDVETLSVGIAGLYGLGGSLVAGWAAHLIHGTLFGVLFAMILADPGLHGLTRYRWKTLVVGLAFGLLLAVIGAGIVMPIWLWAVGATPQPSIPHVTMTTLGWHVVYGLALALLFPVFESW